MDAADLYQKLEQLKETVKTDELKSQRQKVGVCLGITLSEIIIEEFLKTNNLSK